MAWDKRLGADVSAQIARYFGHDAALISSKFVSQPSLAASVQLWRQNAAYAVKLAEGNLSADDARALCDGQKLNVAVILVLQSMLDDPELMAALPSAVTPITPAQASEVVNTLFVEYLVLPIDISDVVGASPGEVTDRKISLSVNSGGLAETMLEKVMAASRFLVLSCQAKVVGNDTSCDVDNYDDRAVLSG